MLLSLGHGEERGDEHETGGVVEPYAIYKQGRFRASCQAMNNYGALEPFEIGGRTLKTHDARYIMQKVMRTADVTTSLFH